MAINKNVDLLTIENARFVFRPNFEGREEQYNEEGHRYFNLFIPEEMVDRLVKDGWNVKFTKPREGQEDQFPVEAFIPVEVGFKYRPPRIILIEDGHETNVDERTVGLLDTVEFEKFDVVIRPYVWESALGSGVKAYLKTFYGTLVMDDLERKYARQRAGE